MKKIALINFYFASKAPDYMDFYISSCAYNSDVDFFVFTNLDLQYEYKNIHIIKMQFKEFANIIKQNIEKALREEGINDEVIIKHPYKIADYRPTFGLCFQQWIKDYDFWGYCDLDVVFGNIRKYVTDELMENYDKLFEHGHFSVIKNSEKCNKMFLKDYRNSFYSVLHMEKNSFFEEVYEKKWLPHGGINSIFEKEGTLYKNRKALCDISFRYGNLIDLKNPSKSKRNVFLFREGHLFRLSYVNKTIEQEEIFYVHFQKRRLHNETENVKEFIADNWSFKECKHINKSIFKGTSRFNIPTRKWIKFRYIDAFKRKLNKDFTVK